MICTVTADKSVRPEAGSFRSRNLATTTAAGGSRPGDRHSRGGGLPDKSYVQAVITSASGNHAPGLQNVHPRVAFEIRGTFIIFVVMTLDIMFELDTLICDAEALAFGRGLSPQLVGVQPL